MLVKLSPMSGDYNSRSWGLGEFVDSTKKYPADNTFEPGRFYVKGVWMYG